jgi:hypothetical protein
MTSECPATRDGFGFQKVPAVTILDGIVGVGMAMGKVMRR